MASGTIAKRKAARKDRALEKGVADLEKLFQKMKREEKPVLPKDFAWKVDKKLQTDAMRRAALLFLEKKTFKEWTNDFGKDRKGTVAFAHVARCLPDVIRRYRDLADMLQTAEIRISMAFAVREDMKAILKEVGRA